MTQEEKQLVFQDICARLPYGVEVQYKGNSYNLKELHKDGRTYLGSYNSIYGDWHCGFNFEDYPKPYLFPLSSMTEELKEEHKDLLDNQYHFDANGNMFTLQDFYCKYHLDYRGLIPMGLAIDCTNLKIY